MAKFLSENKVDSIGKSFSFMKKKIYRMQHVLSANGRATIRLSDAANGGKIQLEFNQRHEQQHFFKG